MKIACIVILYYPDEATYHNLQSYCTQVDKVMIFDNSEQASAFQEQLSGLPNVTLYHDGQNEGIAKRLNSAAFKAIEEGYDWLLMMDQDSSFPDDNFSNYLKCIQQHLPTNDVALFGANHEQDIEIIPHPCNAVHNDELITSGTMLNLALFNSIGPFDENLFIDAVDNEYTIRTLQCGYRVLQFKNIYLKHQIGAIRRRASIKTLFLVKKKKVLHSPIRLYYIYRNNLYLQQKYADVPLAKKFDKSVRFTIKRNLYYNTNIRKMVYYLYRAKQDFKHGRMGKFKPGS